MTEPLLRPGRKNPILRTPLPTQPPGARSRVALGLTAGAARGVFAVTGLRALFGGAVSAARSLSPLSEHRFAMVRARRRG